MKPSNIGGQAVMEGIMMRHKDKYSIAVRRPDKEIEVKVEDYKCIFGKARIWRKPIIRGMVSFIDSLVTGTKCLMYSAEIAGDEEDEEETRKNAALSPEELKAKKKKEDKAFKALLYVTVAVSIVISVAAFMLLPYALASPDQILQKADWPFPWLLLSSRLSVQGEVLHCRSLSCEEGEDPSAACS